MIDEKFQTKIDLLIKEIPNVIDNFKKWGYRKSFDFFFYRMIINERKKYNLDLLLEEEKDNFFITMIYSTLISWDMAKRGAKIKNFDMFQETILENRENILKVSDIKLNKLDSEKEFLKINNILEDIYNNLDLMESASKIVSNSKTLHFLLPNLIMPIDTQNTLKFFSTSEKLGSADVFLKIIKSTWIIAKSLDLNKYLDNEWNATIPKIIDNSIIYLMHSDKYEPKRFREFQMKIEKGGINKINSNKLSEELKTRIKHYFS